MNPTNKPPQLEAPGAGLPAVELFVARLLVRFQCRFTSRERTLQLFAEERAKLLQLARSCSPELGTKPVLIKRLQGMEDSSRYWSVFMTLHHLQIVNSSVAEAIQSLVDGVPVEQEANVADVKPDPASDVTMIDVFDQGCSDYETTLANCGSLRTKLKLQHPWFGTFDAGNWHTLIGVHMTVHRKQVELILAGLNS